LEHKVAREALAAPPDGLNQRACLDAVERRQVGIEQHLLPAQEQNRRFDAFGGHDGARSGHAPRPFGGPLGASQDLIQRTPSQQATIDAISTPFFYRRSTRRVNEHFGYR